MNCENARRRISETLDETRDDAALAAHLGGCAACSRVSLRSRSLNAALASLPQLRPSAAFSAGVLAALARRPSAAPVWPLAAALAASSAVLAAGAARLTLSIPRAAALAAKGCAAAELAGRLALHLLPAPRQGAEYLAAALLASALFLTISLPRAVARPIGAKS